MEYNYDNLSTLNGREINNEDDTEKIPNLTSEIDELIINCVKTNNCRFLDLLLYEPDSNLDCHYYGENMLMLAIRLGNESVAKFLIENGIDFNFEKKIFYKNLIDDREMIDYFYINCREVAYRHGMFEIVEMIDVLNGKHFRFYPTPKIRIRDRSEKPGMFYDVVSLGDEFFTGNYPKEVLSEAVKPYNNLDQNFIVSKRSKSALPTLSYFHYKNKENKSSFLRQRFSSGKNKLKNRTSQC